MSSSAHGAAPAASNIHRHPQIPILDRVLSWFTKPVYEGEGLSTLLLALNVFLLLATYYMLKTVRESLILANAGAEVKSYSSAAQAILLLGVVPAYGWFASRVNRVRLVVGVTLFFVSHLAAFTVLGKAGFAIDVPFYLWLGIFNVMVIAQFWAFAADIYTTEEQGKRLFPVVGIGSSVGALVGAAASSVAFTFLGAYGVVGLAMLLLVVCAGFPVLVNRYRCAACGYQQSIAKEPLGREGGFHMVLRDRYLLLVAILVLLLNLVNTGGEFVLGKLVIQEATRQAVAAADPVAFKQAFIGNFYGQYFTLVSLLGLLLQMFLVSRLFRWIGVRGALFILPCLALGGYALIALLPMLGVIRVAKVLENSCDYSIQNTARHALFLPTSREAKYKAKQAIDTFFWRAGDVAQAGIVLVGAQLAFGIRDYAVVNVAFVILWLVVVALLYGEHRRRELPSA
jgi:AAA family ATP:ADP antiporter